MSRVRAAIGGAALFSGLALLANILLQVSLPLGLLATSAVLGLVLFVVARRSDPTDRRRQMLVARSGLAAGLVATVSYDAARAVLGRADPSPFDPFAALRIFGTLLLGEEASSGAILVAGTTLHLVNGICFGLAYVALFGRDGERSTVSAVTTGIGWGLFLEAFQLTLYPSWSRIGALAEFAVISALSHLVFGAVLGLAGRSFLRRSFARIGAE